MCEMNGSFRLQKIPKYCCNKALTSKLLRQGYRYHKLRNTCSKLNRRHSELVEKYNVSLRKLLQQGISEPEFYGDFTELET